MSICSIDGSPLVSFFVVLTQLRRLESNQDKCKSVFLNTHFGCEGSKRLQEGDNK